MRDSKGRFIKGHEGFWLGKTPSEETKAKLSEAMKYRQGDKNPAWKGGRIKSGNYISLWMPSHPSADAKGYVKEHRVVMEQKIGRSLEPHEAVHHLDHNKYNNEPENLELTTWRDHALKHKAWLARKDIR